GNRRSRRQPSCSLQRMNPHTGRESSGCSPFRLAGHAGRLSEVSQTLEQPRPGSPSEVPLVLKVARIPAIGDTGSRSRVATRRTAVAVPDDMRGMKSPEVCYATGRPQRIAGAKPTAHIHPALATFAIHNTGDTR